MVEEAVYWLNQKECWPSFFTKENCGKSSAGVTPKNSNCCRKEIEIKKEMHYIINNRQTHLKKPRENLDFIKFA